MNHIIGSGVKIISEVDVVTGTTVTLKDLKDPNGDLVLSNQAMAFSDPNNTKNASIVWQSTLNTHVIGRYTFLTKAVNGANVDVSRGFFNLEAE